MKYFAYGANMDPVGMSKRCRSPLLIGPALLRDHALCFRRWRSWRTGVGHVESSPGSIVWGVLWDIDAEDEKRLDRYEAVAGGLYSKARVTVECEGVTHDAMIYLANVHGEKRPSRRYLQKLLRGARYHGAPSDYVAMLRAHRSRRRAARS